MLTSLCFFSRCIRVKRMEFIRNKTSSLSFEVYVNLTRVQHLFSTCPWKNLTFFSPSLNIGKSICFFVFQTTLFFFSIRQNLTDRKKETKRKTNLFGSSRNFVAAVSNEIDRRLAVFKSRKQLSRFTRTVVTISP